MLDLRPTPYRTVWERRQECERHIRQLRAVQRVYQVNGLTHAYECAGERVDVLLTIWQRLNELCNA